MTQITNFFLQSIFPCPLPQSDKISRIFIQKSKSYEQKSILAIFQNVTLFLIAITYIDAEKHCKTYSGPICTMYHSKIEIVRFYARQFRTPILSAPVLNIASSSSHSSKNLFLGKIKLMEAENIHFLCLFRENSEWFYCQKNNE